MHAELQRAKPDIEGTRLVALRPGERWGNSVAYVAVAVAVGRHKGFQSLPDIGELFGVFLVDSTLSKTVRVLDVFPSRRIRDYDVWIQRVGMDSLIVCGQGSSYGDAKMRRAYPVVELPAGAGAPRVDTVFSRSAKDSPQPCPSPVSFGDIE
jgi:hypothetical protein